MAEDDNKLWAGLGYPVWIVALFVALTDKKKESDFLAFHAWQALILNIAIWVIAAVTLGFGSILWLVTLYYGWKAYQGEDFEVPVVGGVARDQV